MSLACLYCDKPVLARQLCSMHYNRLRRTGTLVRTKRRPGPCSVPDCPSWAHARGWCGMHYQRWMKWGTTDERVEPEPVFEDDFWDRVKAFQDMRLAA